MHPGALQRGESASAAISAAQAETQRYRDELGRIRVLLGAQEDRVREFNAILAEQGAAAGSAFALPPDPLTAELLLRDQHVFYWSAAFRAENERATAAETRLVSERAEFGRQIADLKLKLAQRDAAAARRADSSPVAALTEAADRCTDLQRQLADSEAELKTTRAAAKFHKKQHKAACSYYQHKLAQASEATIHALSAENQHRDRADAAVAAAADLEKALADARLAPPPQLHDAPSPSPAFVPASPSSSDYQLYNSRGRGWADNVDYNARRTPPSPPGPPPRHRPCSSSSSSNPGSPVSPYGSRP